MKHYLTIIFLFSLSSLVSADTRFDELFDISMGIFSDSANRVARYHAEDTNLPENEIAVELEALNQNINAFIKSAPDNPALLFLKGLNHSNLANHYSIQKNTLLSTKHSDEKNRAYEKAMQLDKTHTPHLNAAIYATMKHGLPEKLKIEAIQHELDLGGNGENESYYWHLHWSNISALEQAGRLAEAQQALNNMKRELQEQDVNDPDYQQIVSRAQNNINETKTSYMQKTEIDTSQNELPGNKSRSKYTVLLITGLLALIAIVTAYLIRAKK